MFSLLIVHYNCVRLNVIMCFLDNEMCLIIIGTIVFLVIFSEFVILIERGASEKKLISAVLVILLVLSLFVFYLAFLVCRQCNRNKPTFKNLEKDSQQAFTTTGTHQD